MSQVWPETEIMYSEDVKGLTKLQAFIDHAMGVSLGTRATAYEEGELKNISDVSSLLDASCRKGHSFTLAFLRMAFENTPEYRQIAACLRRTEAYSMVAFLLREGAGEKVEALSARYGISAGHFRRMFRAAFGCSPKSELNDWRLATAVLAVIERQQSVTDIAMAHGYASPSHFSNEVKKSLGLSLTHLFDAQRK
jgi:AraC-like DNA-binding protein